MIHKDLPWLVGSYFARFKRKASDPKAHFLILAGDIRLRTRRVLFTQLLLFLLAYGMVSIADVSGGIGFGPARSITLAMWLVTLVAYLIASVQLPRVNSALLARLSLAAAAVPLAVSFLAVGTQASLYLMGPSAIFVMLATGGTVAFLLRRGIRTGRTRFRELIDKRKYRRLLQRELENWSPEFTVEPQFGKVGCLAIGLSVSGPAIGMHLSKMIGRSGANIVLAILPIFLGAIFIYGVGYQIGTYLIEMRRIELNIGRPLTLAPYREDDGLSAA